MSGDHNQYQKDKSYLDDMDRYKQVRELVKDPSLRIKDIAELTGYNKGHVSRLRKASQQFECPRCGHCCQADQLTQQQEPVAWLSEGGDVSRSKRYMDEMGFKCNPLYTAPPKREWVELTDEEIYATYDEAESLVNTSWANGFGTVGLMFPIAFYELLEAKLKERNG